MKQQRTLLIVLLVFVLLLAAAYLLYNSLSDKVGVTPPNTDATDVIPGDTGTTGEGQQTTEKTANPAPDFTVYDGQGNPVKLSDYIGKPIVLNFWASWCPPCKAEMPAIEKFHGNYKDANAIAVNTDPEADVKGFADQLGLTFPIVLDEEDRTMKNYSVMGIPTTYFIDEQGIITQKYVGEMDYEMIEEFAAGM